MATMGTKLALLLGLFMAGSLLAAAQPDRRTLTVTIRNPSLLALDIMNDDKNVRVTSASATLDINHEEQRLQISAGGGEDMDVTVHDGDVLVVIPDPADAGNSQVFKIVKGGEEPRPDTANLRPPPMLTRKVLPGNLPQANEAWPEMRP